MASASSFLSEEQFQCSICLHVFTEPVAIQCGHTFCKTCITKYWDDSDLCQCPLCKKIFSERPDICVNVVLLEMAVQFNKSDQIKTACPPDQEHTKEVDVPCDICTGMKNKALKTCLVCLVSYCETHLEPHERVASLKKHILINPVENLEHRVCKKHERPLELFCRTDQTCVCQFCTEGDHRTHDTVPIEEEYREKKTQMRKKVAEVQQMIQEREEKVREIKQSVELSRKDTKQNIADQNEFFTSLVAFIQKSQAEVIEEIEEKQEATERRAEDLIKELEQESTELKKKGTELEQLSHTEDHLHLLHSSPSLSTPPPNKDLSDIHVHSGLSMKTLRRTLTELKETLTEEIEKWCDGGFELKRIQQYAVDVTLDPDTAHPELILSEDGKQVHDGGVRKNLPDNPERFSQCIFVLVKQSFSSGRFYYEVEVKEKTHWFLGVARESINRKGSITLQPVNGYWTVELWGGEYKAHNDQPVVLSLKEKPQIVGVFVDYEEGLVSFYDVEAKAHIYSFTDCTFTDKLFPFFCPWINNNGTNSSPLIICPVNNKE
ncbi:E3 ubiquitin-protein ligase TRIM39-like isoform 1-T1 [Polymixia lowei]